MKRIFLILMAVSIFTPLSAQIQLKLAGQAKAYIFEQTSNSITSDGYVSVKYTLSLKQISNRVYLNQPRLDIEITNTSDKAIVIDLEKSLYKVNTYSDLLFKDSSLPILAIEPYGSYVISDINPLPSEAVSHANNIFYYHDVLKTPICYTYCDKLSAGQLIDYDETSTPLTIGSSIVYHSADDDVEYVVNTQYYAFKKVALKFITQFSTKLLDKAFPDWRMEQYLTFVLFCRVGK